MLFLPLILLWQLLTQFLLSPWGLIVPMTLLIALFSLQQIQKTPEQLAQYYAEQLETCSESELPALFQALVRLGDAGVSGLTQGLNSSREPVFTASRTVLRQEFDRWQKSEQRERHFLVFAETLLQNSRLTPAAQNEVILFVEQMMAVRPEESMTPESTVYRQQMLAHCEQILDQLASVRRRKNEPQHSDFSPQSDALTALNQRTRQSVLLASNGMPFVPTSDQNKPENEMLLAETNKYNALSVPRAERLWAYQNNARQESLPSTVDTQELQGVAHFSPPTGRTANVEERLAHNFGEKDFAPVEPEEDADISENYRNGKLSESGGTLNSDFLLTPDLKDMPLQRVPQVPTTQLMQLLHHPKLPFIESAQKTLMGRDGFQEVHLKLAWRLYHPIPTVRLEILEMLSKTPNVQASVWLEVLLNDPNNDVRYRTASYLATSGDPALRRLLIHRGRRDNDARIVNLANRLEESRGNIR